MDKVEAKRLAEEYLTSEKIDLESKGIPDKFNLTDGAIAAIINCCFDLDAEVSSDDVKGWRKEGRIRGKKID